MTARTSLDALGLSNLHVSETEEALRQHEPALRAYLARRVRSRQDLEDYVQDVYVRVLSAAPPSGKIHSWRGFLLRVASNLLIDRKRRNDVRRQEDHVPLDMDASLVDPYGHSPERVLMAREQLAVLAETLENVESQAREVFLAVRVEGLSHKEAGARIGVDAKTASRLVERVLVVAGRNLRKLEE